MRGRPRSGPALLVDDERGRTFWQDAEGLQEFDDGVLLVGREFEVRVRDGLSFAMMCEHGLAQGGELAVMEERRLVCSSPQLLGEEAARACKKARIDRGVRAGLRDSRALLHVDRIAVRVTGPGGDVVQL